MHLWADHHDGSPEDVFEFQDRITDSVVAVIAPLIEAAEFTRARRERPDSLDAYDIFLRYREMTHSGHFQDYDETFATLQPALERFPNDPRLLFRAVDALEHRIIMGAPSLGANDKQMCID